MITKAAHQGDIYIKKAQLPEKVEEIGKENGRTIIAYGEQTGHHHAFAADNVRLYATKDVTKQSRRFIVISGYPATLTHEEHDPLEFAPGTYEIFRAREWSDDDEPRVVAD